MSPKYPQVHLVVKVTKYLPYRQAFLKAKQYPKSHFSRHISCCFFGDSFSFYWQPSEKYLRKWEICEKGRGVEIAKDCYGSTQGSIIFLKFLSASSMSFCYYFTSSPTTPPPSTLLLYLSRHLFPSIQSVTPSGETLHRSKFPRETDTHCRA